MQSESIAVDEQTVHTVLNYCLTQSAITNKSINSTMQIPYEILALSNGLDPSKFPGASLEIKMSFKWVESEDSETVDMEIDDE